MKKMYLQLWMIWTVVTSLTIRPRSELQQTPHVLKVKSATVPPAQAGVWFPLGPLDF